MTNKSYITGFPRIGENRELKKALELFWSGNGSLQNLRETAEQLRTKHWLMQKEQGIGYISSNDFSYYDNMLDTAVMLNALPRRFRQISDPTEQYFAMARGSDTAAAMEMTKWFNTNYHYIVPELEEDTDFRLNAEKILSEYKEARMLGIRTKINIIGPLTFLGLSKTTDGTDPYRFLEKLLPVYAQLLLEIAALDDTVYIQMEEPILSVDPVDRPLSQIHRVYNTLGKVSEKVRLIVATYFEHSCEAAALLAQTPIWGLGLDFVHGKKNLQALETIRGKTLIAGVVDGRNIWLNDYSATLSLLEEISRIIPKDRMILSTSCSLLHTPFSAAAELDSPIKQWLSFAEEKLAEVSLLSGIFFTEKQTLAQKKLLEENKNKTAARSDSRFIRNDAVVRRRERMEKTEREGRFEQRRPLQHASLNLPVLPTTTIGSFPQTPQLRQLRRDFKKGLINRESYESSVKEYIDACIRFQEDAGLDVLVHGEPERNDMVEYFGELLEGIRFTRNGWVQSYGSRCVKPPVIFGDVHRPEPMTVKWISYAQSRTEKVVKGMLTGPVTIINWSFVRDDIPRSEVAEQIASALSDEIADLQKAGIKIIQVDEAAFKEGYPLRRENVAAYETWAVDSFKRTVSTAEPKTQIHTHMCYSQFNDIIGTIEKMDADVITIETARSGNKLLRVFREAGYKNEIGPGVYDIHSPRIPSVEEFKQQIRTRLEVVAPDRIWINPDCGLKTRKWEEVEPALKNMVRAVAELRD